MQSELLSNQQQILPASALSLFLAAFDGVPQPGTRQLRLSDAEKQELADCFPSAAFVPLEQSGEKRWYQVTVFN